MTRNGGKVHVVRVRKTGYVDKQGRRKDYSSAYLRRTYRDGGTVKNETVANLSALPDHVIDLIDAGLKGQQLVPATEAVTITASLPHGHVAAAHAMARKLGLPALLGPAGPQRDLARARPGHRGPCGGTRRDRRPGSDDLVPAGGGRRAGRDGRTWRRIGGPNPARMALFDLSSSWLRRVLPAPPPPGRLRAALYGLLQPAPATAGRRIGGRDPAARRGRLRWITALRAPAIRKLMADDGPLQLSLFDQQDLAEITSEDFPGERLIACRNPVLAADRARTREDLLAATEKLLAPVIARVQAGKLTGAGPIGVEVGKVISRYKTAKHFAVTITEVSLTVARRQDQIDAEAALDGFYVLRTPVPAAELDAPAVVTAYKNLKYVERDFRHIKSDDLDLRPVFHRLEERVKAHVLICMLACYLTWHLRRAWAPLTFTGQDPPAAASPVAPARRSAAAQAKASYQHDPAGQPYRSFRGLLEHRATLTRNQVRYTGTEVTIPMLTEPTSAQRQAFQLIGTPIPLTLT